MNEALHARERATIAQQTASDPRISSWVGASAGSGKTKVLTDRVLRLLLREDAAPGRILCLTFTKAAAAEMQTRLAKRLGAWSALSDDALRAEVEKVIADRATRAELDTARRLFCRVLEQPGGMRILTIHAFCQSLLQSFPLEAQLPPGFAMLEEADSDALLAEAREAALAGGMVGEDALAALSRLVSADALGTSIRVLNRHRARVEPILAGSPDVSALLHGCLGLPDGECEDDVAAAFCAPPEDILAAARLLAEHKNKNEQKLGARMLALLSLPPEKRTADEWWGCLHTDKGERRAILKDECFARECARLADLEARRTAHRLRAATDALLSAAKPVLRDYEARKGRRGALDFDDLIARAQALLLDPGSAWVLFKLDGGLDHILLDEAQDTNPAQWGIAEAIAAEFFAGSGTREAGERTFFAVGDAKQSIFGFQGADARGFLTRQTTFESMIETGGGTFVPVPLSVSFRSCAPILSLVDRVFEEGPARKGVVPDGETLEHSTDRAGQSGMVEIWPPLERPAKDDAPAWVVPETPVPAQDAEAQLADAVAARIRHMIRHETLPARGDRPIGPGDIMVLVRRRTRFLDLLVSALKLRGVPVGGVDRLKLVDQIAVADVMALLDSLLLPEDDLSLAAALKSPLIGLSEDDLFSLCHGRDGRRLWHVLRERRGEDGAIGRAAGTVADLMARADYVTPHALMSEILGEGGGRARLLARLGTEAAEALDELLSAAIRYESRNPPSLQGFLHWLRAGGATVKREAENAGGAVRIMTAHGAKGLESPVVILPDIGRGGARDTLMWSGDERGGANQPTIPLWAPRKEFQARAWRDAKTADEERQDEEENRLLYVALTRAEDRLVVCGIAPAKPPAHPPWHQQVKDGFFRGHDRGEEGYARVPFAPAAFGYAGNGVFGEEGWEVRCLQSVPPREEPITVRAEGATLPRWASEPAPPEASEDPVAPSRDGGEEGPAAAPHGAADPGGRRFRRGLLIHALLQFLPDHPAGAREGIALRHLSRPGHGLTAEERDATWREARGVLDHPALTEAFGPGSLAEAPLAGTVHGRAIAGQVDRLWVGPDRVIVMDYKTNRPPPSRVEDVSPAYLRQMAAYRAVLRAAWPGRRVECALVWTWSGHVMALSDAVLDPHAPGSRAGG